jgi:hypothetical protein
MTDLPHWAQDELDALQRTVDGCRILAAHISRNVDIGDVDQIRAAVDRLADYLDTNY